jgi:hypothetical protein
MSVAELLSHWWQVITAALGTFAGGAGYIRQVDKRSRKNKRQLQGDPDDPNHEGALEMLRDTRDKVDHLDAKVESQHEEVIHRVDDLAEERRNHD